MVDPLINTNNVLSVINEGILGGGGVESLRARRLMETHACTCLDILLYGKKTTYVGVTGGWESVVQCHMILVSKVTPVY